MKSTQPSMFKTPEGQARYFAAYDRTMALWSVPVTPLTVPTRLGLTHVNTCGPEGAPPLLLLHGAAVSSTMWYPNIAALSQNFRVYAPDIIGEMGKSIRTRLVAKPADYSDWLIDLLDGLKLDKTHVAGISLGGYLAIQLALAARQRVAKLVLLAPASLLPMGPRFFLRAMAAIFVPFLSPSARQALTTGVASPAAEPVVRQMMTRTDFKYKMFLPPVTSDDELRQICPPTLLLLGEREVTYAPQKALQRAARLIPRLEVHILPGAGHALNLDQPEAVNQCILEFLGKGEGFGE